MRDVESFIRRVANGWIVRRGCPEHTYVFPKLEDALLSVAKEVDDWDNHAISEGIKSIAITRHSTGG